MDKKFYVSLEAAKLLKEKGYNEQCEYCFYYDDYHDKWDYDSPYNLFDDDPMYYNNETIDDEMYSMPTKAEAIDWLERKGIVIELRYDNDELQKDDSEWIYYIYQYDNEGRLDETVSSWAGDNYYKTRLEAEDAAIIKALEILNTRPTF